MENSTTLQKAKKEKVSAFILFMREKRKTLEGFGKRFPGGWKDVAAAVNAEWQNMPEPEKEKWKELAQQLKENQESDASIDVDDSNSNTAKVVVKEENREKGPAETETRPPPSVSSGNDCIWEDEGQSQRSLNSHNFKKVLQEYHEGSVHLQIKSRFLSLVQDFQKLRGIYFSLVHFNYYDKGDSPFTFEPAEVAFAQWNIAGGIKVFRGSLIDTRNITKNEKDHRNVRRSEKLYVPAPCYTYEKGVGYSAGEDDYNKILRAIYDNCIIIKDFKGDPWKYVFTASGDVEVVRGCLAWLMEKSGPEVDLNLRVFPLESVLQEFFRCCAIVRSLRDQGLWEVCESPDKPLVLDAQLTKENYEFVCRVASLQYVKLHVMGPRYFGNRKWDYQIKLGCTWHQQEINNGGISHCSTMFVRKWSCLSLLEAKHLMDLPAGSWLKFLTGPEMTPRPYNEKDAALLELRQRLGIETVTPRRKFELEERFIFPNLLEILKTTYPKGLASQPENIIWPVDRDMEVDLNYCDSAVVKIEDPDRILTLMKRREKAQRDAELTNKHQHSFEN